MPTLQAIYPYGFVPAREQVLPDTPGPISKAEQEAPGSNVGLHSKTVREAIRVGGTGSPYAFYNQGRYFFWRFACEVDAREWGCYMGFEFDGEMTERGLEVALNV